MLKNIMEDEELKSVFDGFVFKITVGKYTNLPIFDLFENIKMLCCYDRHFDIDKKIDCNIKTLEIRLYGKKSDYLQSLAKSNHD